MDKTKPFERIAERFRISQESAKYFLNHVQKSFKVERPPHKLIVEFVEAQEIRSLPATPYEVAALMKEKGVWVYALGSPPPTVVDDEDLDV
jgi:hypothetical protein